MLRILYTHNASGVIRPTRYAELGYQLHGPKSGGVWRIIDRQTGNAIGPQYHTLRELLADLERFAELYGASSNG